jgi:hypothetical protein
MPFARFTVVVALSLLVSVLPSSPRGAWSARGEQVRESNRQQNDAESSAKDSSRPATVPDQPEASTNARTSEKETQQTRRNYFAEAFAPSSLPNWALCLFAVVAAVIALCTLKVIEKQVEANILEARAAKDSADTAASSAKLAERALLLTERADLLITGINTSTPGEFEPGTVFTLVFKNFGRTRADSVIVNCSLGVPDAPRVDQSPEKVPTVVGAGDTLPVPFGRVGQCLNQETAVKVASGETPFRFEGEMTYKDVFGFGHRTKCSGTYLPKRSTFSVDGNQAD